MTTYSAITSSEIDADSPLTDVLFGKLRDNPIAITEGASGAPRVTAAALNTVTNTLTGTLNGGLSVSRTIGGFAFSPCFNGTNFGFTQTFDATGADDLRIIVKNNNGSSASYAIYWRSIV